MELSYDDHTNTLVVTFVAKVRTTRFLKLAPFTTAFFDRWQRLVCIEICKASSIYSSAVLELFKQRPGFLSLAQAAEEISLSPATLRKQIHNKKLKAVKLGRDWLVTPTDLSVYVEKHRRAKWPEE